LKAGTVMRDGIKIYAFSPERTELGEIGAYARRAEAIGFDGVYVADAIHDGFLMAHAALAATTRIQVSISVLVAFPRSPMHVALSAWDLQKLSGGRLEIGLGTQIRQNVEDRFSARWLPPAAGMREYIGATRAIFRAFRGQERLNFQGEHYRFSRLQSFFNPGPIAAPDPAITMGAVGPLMLKLVGEAADGMHTHPTNTIPSYLREVVLPSVAQGLERRDPALPKPKICIMDMVATGPDAATVEQERLRSRDMLAFVFSTPAYWIALEQIGRKDLGEQLLQLTREGRWAEMSAAVPDDITEAFTTIGTFDEVPRLLADRFGGLVDRITMTVPADPAHDAACAACLDAIRAAWPDRFPFQDT
jgi:probable F420-dependent oxidoreductase